MRHLCVCSTRIISLLDSFHFFKASMKLCPCTVFFFFKGSGFVLFIYLFIFGCTGSLLLHPGFSLVEASRGHSLLWCTGLSLRWPPLLRSAGSRTQAQQLQRTDLVAPWHVGSSRTSTRTRVPCIGRRTPNHCATREALYCFYFTVFHGI